MNLENSDLVIDKFTTINVICHLGVMKSLS